MNAKLKQPMHPFEQTISVIGPIVGAIIVLTLFFRSLTWFDRRSAGEGAPNRFRGVVGRNTRVTVHLNNGNTFEDVLLVGFVDGHSGKVAIPFEWRTLVILEQTDGRRFLIPARQLRMIEVPPSA
jgi:hypothetical protein